MSKILKFQPATISADLSISTDDDSDLDDADVSVSEVRPQRRSSATSEGEVAETTFDDGDEERNSSVDDDEDVHGEDVEKSEKEN